MNRAVALMAILAWPALAAAQPAPEPVTVLHLSASGSVQAAPDLLVAELTAQSTDAAPAAAQLRVNDLVAAGMKLAQAVPGVDARAVGYTVHPADDKRTAWVAQQTLELRATGNGAALLDLVGRLQQRGLTTAALDWQLSPTLYQASYDQATDAALKSLTTHANAAAAALGLRVDHLKDVRLDSPGYMAKPRPGVMMARAAAAPQASAAAEDVSATASADVALVPAAR